MHKQGMKRVAVLQLYNTQVVRCVHVLSRKPQKQGALQSVLCFQAFSPPVPGGFTGDKMSPGTEHDTCSAAKHVVILCMASTGLSCSCLLSCSILVQ